MLPSSTLMGFRSSSVIVAALLAALTTTTAAASETIAHQGDSLLKVQAWPDQLYELGLDVWTHRTDEPNVLVRVTQLQRATLDASGFEYVVVEPDLGPLVEAEATRLAALPDPLGGGGLDPAYYDDYRDFDDVLDRLAGLATIYPQRVSVVELGMSLEGRPIRGLRITNPGADDRPVITVQGCQHAREWIAVAAPVYAAEQLAAASAGGYVDGLLDQVEIVVVPVLNPDGYVYSWEAERFWRKNRRDGHGVDLNRNWSVVWGGEGASPDPDAENYYGAGPFSEPESTAMRDFLTADPDMVALLDVHSYGQLLLYPWGFGFVDSADDMLFADLSQGMSDAMWQPHNTWYQPIQSSDLYPAAGNAIDWAYGVEGLYAITVELRPDFADEMGFLLEPAQLVPTGEELLASILELVESSIALGPGLPGDSGGQVGDTGDDEGTTDGTEGGGDTTTEGGAQSTGGSGVATTGMSGSESGQEPPIPAGTTGAADTDTDTDDPGLGDGGSDGCGCRSTGGGSSSAWWLLMLGGVVVARRRRPAA